MMVAAGSMHLLMHEIRNWNQQPQIDTQQLMDSASALVAVVKGLLDMVDGGVLVLAIKRWFRATEKQKSRSRLRLRLR